MIQGLHIFRNLYAEDHKIEPFRRCKPQTEILFLRDINIFRYAAPEQYIMSTQTPSAPSAPVAAALSPVLWQVQTKLLTSLVDIKLS